MNKRGDVDEEKTKKSNLGIILIGISVLLLITGMFLFLTKGEKKDSETDIKPVSEVKSSDFDGVYKKEKTTIKLFSLGEKNVYYYIDANGGTIRSSGSFRNGNVFGSLFDENFVYLYAERTPPQRSYRKNSGSTTDSRLGDKHGHLTAFRFYQAMSKGEKIQVPELQLSDKDDTVIMNTSAWMNRIMNSSIRISANEESTDQISISYVIDIHGDNFKSSPLNVAFGNSYIFPIILAILTAPAGSLIIIENPEAHLHPSAQFRMGEFLALAAQNGIQLIIETHSDHLLNGVRVMTKKKKMDADKVEIHYISQDEEDPRIHQDERILLEEDGSLSHWPEGFFDEWELALREINK